MSLFGKGGWVSAIRTTAYLFVSLDIVSSPIQERKGRKMSNLEVFTSIIIWIPWLPVKRWTTGTFPRWCQIRGFGGAGGALAYLEPPRPLPIQHPRPLPGPLPLPCPQGLPVSWPIPWGGGLGLDVCLLQWLPSSLKSPGPKSTSSGSFLPLSWSKREDLLEFLLLSLTNSDSESVRTAPRPGGHLKIIYPSSSDIILLDPPSSSDPLLAYISSKTWHFFPFFDAMTIRSIDLCCCLGCAEVTTTY